VTIFQRLMLYQHNYRHSEAPESQPSPESTSSNTCTAMSKTVTTLINYSSHPANDAKLYSDFTKFDSATGTYDRNWTEVPTQVEIEDIRGKEGDFTLDTAGFQYGVYNSAVKDFYDEQEIKDIYYPECVALLKRITGASHTLIFDHSTCP
jgi:hypothetical protein